MALALFGAACLTIAGGALARRAVLRHGSIRNAIKNATTAQYPEYDQNSKEEPVIYKGTLEDMARRIRDETDLMRTLKYGFKNSSYYSESLQKADWEKKFGSPKPKYRIRQNINADNLRTKPPRAADGADKDMDAQKEEESMSEATQAMREQAQKFFAGGFESTMTVDEASMILGIALEDAADQKKLTAAHRRVMLRNHPDRGGSPFLATKINEAKDLLLNSQIDAAAIKEKKKEEAQSKEKERSESTYDVVEEELEDEVQKQGVVADLGGRKTRRPPRSGRS